MTERTVPEGPLDESAEHFREALVSLFAAHEKLAALKAKHEALLKRVTVFSMESAFAAVMMRTGEPLEHYSAMQIQRGKEEFVRSLPIRMTQIHDVGDPPHVARFRLSLTVLRDE